MFLFCGAEPQRGDSSLTGGSLFQHRLSGGLEPRMRFTLSGRLLSLHQLSGGRELPQASSPYPGGEFFAEPQRGVRLPGGGKKEGTPAVSLPLWTPTFPLLLNLAQIADM